MASVSEAEQPDEAVPAVEEKQHPQREFTYVCIRLVLKVLFLTQSRVRSCLTIAGAFLSAFCTTGYVNSFGVFQEYYRTHQLHDKSDFDIVWIASFLTFIMFVFAPIAGVITDRTHPFIPLCFGSICHLVAVFMTSLCSEYYQFFLAQGLLGGIGMCFITIPAVATVPCYFVKNRGLAMGIVIGGSSIGGVIWPIEINNLLNIDGISFGWTIRIIGFTMLPLCIFLVLAVRPPPPTTGAQQALPAKPGAKAAGDLLKKPSFAFLCSGVALLFFGFFTPLFFITTYGVEIGMSTSFSFYLPSIALAASFFGRTIPGFLSDRYGPFNILLLSCISSCVVAFCWTTATSVAGIVVWSLAYGFSSGSFLSLQSTCASKLASKETQGTAQGLVFGATAIT